MRFIHTADVHLDSKMDAHLGKEEAKARRAECLATFTRLVAYAAENAVSGILISGDLFDTNTVKRATRESVLDEIRRHPDIRFFYLRGNHDKTGLTEGLSAVPENLCLFSEDWTTYELGNVTVTGAEISDEKPELLDTLVLNPGKVNLVMLHGQVAQSPGSKPGERIDLRKLQNRGIDYLALGHVHEYREETLDAHGFYAYSGCLEGRGFDETGEKGFVLLDVNPDTRLITRIFVPFARRTVYRVEVPVTEATSSAEMAARCEEAVNCGNISPESLVEVVLTGETDEETEPDLALVSARLAGRFFVCRVKDETKTRVNYAAYENDASLKGEFVRRVFADQSLTEEEKATVIRYGIEALSGEVRL